jgi:PAS domain S-box-containing protein
MNKPLKLTIVVALTGVLWILLSDYLLKVISDNTTVNFVMFSSIKGIVYVALISFVVYKISSHYFRQMSRSQRSYQNMFFDNPHPMYLIDPEAGRFLEVNKAAIKRYGFSRDELHEMKLTAASTTANEEVFLQDYLKKMPDNEYHSGVWTLITKDGIETQADIYSMQITYKGKKARLVTAYDLTEITATRQLLEQERQKLQKLIDHQTIFLLWLSVDGDIVFSNQHFNSTFSDQSETKVKILAELSDPKERTILLESLARANSKGITSAVLKYSINDETRHVKWEFIRINSSENSEALIQASGYDITQMKLNESTVMNQNERLSEIAWMASHEIRKPVANLLGIFQLIDLDNPGNAENTEWLIAMEKATQELDDVIHKINEKTNLVDIKSSLHA